MYFGLSFGFPLWGTITDAYGSAFCHFPGMGNFATFSPMGLDFGSLGVISRGRRHYGRINIGNATCLCMMTSAAARRSRIYHAMGSGRPPCAGAAYPSVTRTAPGSSPGEASGILAGPGDAVYLRGLSSGLSYRFSHVFFNFSTTSTPTRVRSLSTRTSRGDPCAEPERRRCRWSSHELGDKP